MTDARADASGPGAAPLAATPEAGEVLRRADGVQLIGEMAGSGYRVPPSLARRRDGQTVQLTPLLYQTLEAVDGRRGYDEVAAVVSERSGRSVTADNVRTLVSAQLRPLGLLTKADGGEPELKRSDPLLGLRFRYALTDPERTRRVTAPFALLFHAVVAVPLLAAFAVVCWWVFIEKGLARATYEAFQHPGLLILVFVVTVLSAGFHEFGHAAAARYGGATPGVMGAGLYLVWPAFYTDVTDSYRLGRAARVRTDLGGLYFNAIVAVAVTGVWWATRYDALLLIVATQILQMLQQLTPLIRFDGYHVLADLTGVPDLFHRIKPTLLGALPWRWGDPEARLLKPWARVVVTLWVVVVVPLLGFALILMVLALPRIVGTAWARLQQEQHLLAATGDGDLVQATARVLVMAAVVLPVAGIIYLLVRLVRRAAVSTWRATDGRPARRAVAGLLAGALAAGLAWAWWPDAHTYRPIQPHERGTITEAVSGAVQPLAALGRPTTQPYDAAVGLRRGDVGSATTVWAGDEPLPTADEPRPAVIIVPRDPGPVAADDPSPTGTAEPTSAPTADTGTPVAEPTGVPTTPGATAAPTAQPGAWVFPFDRPLAPGPGDNQALAANTTDATTLYDVAFAMVWVDGDEPALNTNEAYAFASCRDCASVAIAFQVVMVIGDNDIAVPQNLAAAVNYDCINCLTYALAQQLFLTLDGPLSADAIAQLDQIWLTVQELGAAITGIPLDEIDDRLDAFEEQILAVIEADLPGTVPTVAPSATPSDSSSLGDGGAATPAPTALPTDGPTSTSSPGPTTPDPTGSTSPTDPTSPTAATGPTPTSPSTTEPTPTGTASEPSPNPSGEPSPSTTGTTGGSGTATGDASTEAVTPTP